ncbi:HAD-IB family hydrolase [Mycolicibacterium sp. CBMA 361]|uniref:HAD family hydrolase n=1 Tax=Mycolicibacterium sp. CBMA 361 TaxID=2606610 RepID=UPI0012DDB453|nr:HAD-IB family hydrolase [Mycolicibacterium sp. CBMA 361]MUM34117.1 HAD-IB family hydrolase [Mycolicibacterium sp. CBMA 361]
MSAPNAGPLEDLDTLDDAAQNSQIGAFFDVDGTLVDGFIATIHAAHRFRQRQAAFGELTGILEATLRYKLRRMEFERLLVRASGYMRGESLAEQEALGEELFRSRVQARIFPTMREVVRTHQDSGHTVVLSSSALTMHVMPLARYLGVEHVICNHFTVDADGILTGDIVRPIVWGHRKASAVEEFSQANDVDLQQSYFYADGDEDLPLMRVVGHPIPVNPRPALAAEAERLGWTVVRALPAVTRY